MRKGFAIIEALMLTFIVATFAMIFICISCNPQNEDKGKRKKKEKVILKKGKKIIPTGQMQSTLKVMDRANQTRCQENLRQMGLSMRMYVMSEGNNVRYPQADGGGFLAKLYSSGVLRNTEIFRCPSTGDEITPEKLKALGRRKGKNAVDLDEENAISYAGRKNSRQGRYPGIAGGRRRPATCVIGSDDWQDTPNHANGAVVCFLFLDGHTARKIDEDAPDKSMKGQYECFAKGKGKFKYTVADPLTN